MRNPRNVTELEAGYNYLIPSYKVTNEGIQEHGDAQIWFCRGDKIDESKPRQEGFFVESLLEVCKQRLLAVNKGDLANLDTAVAITKIEEAIMWLEKRQSDRKVRGVEGTYQK